MTYIGALGFDTFQDEIESVRNSLATRINGTRNYVWTTINILATRINETSNISTTRINDTSNVLVKRITDEVRHTSNYADCLDLRIKSLERTEGSSGDINWGMV